MKAWLDPQDDSPTDLTVDLAERVGSLHHAFAQGARFLACPVQNNREAARWALACFHSPLAFVPLPPALPPALLARRLRQLPAGVVLPEALPPPRADSSPRLREKKEIWAVIFSSGTSGEPKGVALSGAAIEASARAHAAHAGAAASAPWLLNLPLYHVGGFSVLTRALFLDLPFALAEARFSAEDTARWIASGKATGLSLVPTTLLRLLREPVDLARVRWLLLGGAPAAPELVREALARGAPVRLTYGMTEHASQIATETASGSGLVPLPGVSLRVEGDEILVRSDSLAAGYYQAGELTPLPLRDGYFATGDLGVLHENRLEVRGRLADVIHSGGKKIFPQALERELQSLPEVADAAVLGLPDLEWGELACAAVVERSHGAFVPAKTQSILATRLESYQIPKRWVLLPAIPRSPSGKILQAELRAAVEEALKTRP